jgi:2-hydroxychromene-2-carboxylate isomerase
MSKTVEFYFDLGSPASYLAWTQLPALCARHDAQLLYRPMLLGGVFQATGNASPAMVPAKGRYMFIDLALCRPLWRAVWPAAGVSGQHPEPDARGHGHAVAGAGAFRGVAQGVVRGLWVQQRNLSDAAVLAATLIEGGFDPRRSGAGRAG